MYTSAQFFFPLLLPVPLLMSSLSSHVFPRFSCPLFSRLPSRFATLTVMKGFRINYTTHTRCPLHPTFSTANVCRGYLNCPDLLAPRDPLHMRIMLPLTPSLTVMKGSRVIYDHPRTLAPSTHTLSLLCEWKKESVEREDTNLFKPFWGSFKGA
ncbi:MAG: hypothetical protein J3Q66DRAFT_132056 [Benniella sp.]|nr:MAG: hypothetical protein J3Q66DRAFT_132056 [Benniella sp.]